MHKDTILRLALPTPLRRLFDYLPPQGIDPTTLIPGVRLCVPFQSRMLVGVLVEVVSTSSVPYEKLKRALEVLDQQPVLSADVQHLCEWSAEYYHYALGEVLASALPTLLRKGKLASSKKKWEQEAVASDQPPQLNDAQQQAVQAITHDRLAFHAYLLDGVTGSGKTEVYLRAIESVLQENKQVLVLVPEISLTPQTVDRFRARFSVPVVALHSSLSEQARLQAWLAARDGKARVVIGTRSAIFTPFKQLGLIIVDEEHDPSFKQQDRFRYHARDLAVMRASHNQIPVVLGSATPSLESLLNVRRERYQHLVLPHRAGEAMMPPYQLLDVRTQKMEEGLSAPLLQAMREELAAGNQVMLFLNRRGFAPVYFCTACGWIAGCRRCDARLVYHRSPPRLQCHHCDSRQSLPKQCEKCSNTDLHPVGLGTQRLEEALHTHFPDVPVIRVDRDNTRRKDAMKDLLKKIHETSSAILLGTQMLAKGHHFPQVTLVGVVEADSGLFSADFRAAEQMGQLLLQVAGRAGRAEKRGRVLIQTRCPDHPLLRTLLEQGYSAFAAVLMAEREQAVLPPYSYFAVIRAEAYGEIKANHFLDTIKKMSAAFSEAVTILGPVPALIAKRKGLHCQNLLIKSDRRGALQQFLKKILHLIDDQPASASVKWVLDVDPVEVG